MEAIAVRLEAIATRSKDATSRSLKLLVTNRIVFSRKHVVGSR